MHILYLLTHETPLNKIPNVSLHIASVILETKITVHLHATRMHSESRVVEFLEDVLSHISQLGNHDILKNYHLCGWLSLRHPYLTVPCPRWTISLGFTPITRSPCSVGMAKLPNSLMLPRPKLSHSLKHLLLPGSYTSQYSP